MKRRRWSAILIILFIMVSGAALPAQEMVTGGLYGPGGVGRVPHALVEAERRLVVGVQHLPAGATHLDYSRRNGVGERAYYARLGFLPRTELTLRLVHPDGAWGRYGIGDRSVALKVALLREGRWLPALSAGVADPMGTRLMPASWAVASKTMAAGRRGAFLVTAGYAPTLFGEQAYALRGPLLALQFIGRAAAYHPAWSAGVEYHDGRINAALHLHPFSFLQFQAFWLEGRYLAVGVGSRILL